MLNNTYDGNFFDLTPLINARDLRYLMIKGETFNGNNAGLFKEAINPTLNNFLAKNKIKSTIDMAPMFTISSYKGYTTMVNIINPKKGFTFEDIKVNNPKEFIRNTPA